MLSVSLFRTVIVAGNVVLLTVPVSSAVGREGDVSPVVQTYCSACHSNGAAEGGFDLDAFPDETSAAANPQAWWKVLKNVRAGVMPPAGEPRPSADEVEQLNDWIKRRVFQIDLEHPDPGQLTVRRLNRTEYGNTVADLMGVRFDASILFPPDDSGFGFDNVGDALSFSPLLMEKYLRAAEAVVAEAVPTTTWIVPMQTVAGREFRDRDTGDDGHGMSSRKASTVRRSITLDEPGRYDIRSIVQLDGTFEFDPSRYVVVFCVDGEELSRNEYGWDENKRLREQFQRELSAGDHELSFELIPLNSDDEPGIGETGGSTSASFDVVHVELQGPAGTTRLRHPNNYERFFPLDDPPQDPTERETYARQVLDQFCRRAFRGSVPAGTLDRLMPITVSAWQEPGVTFEAGVARAMTAVLASPRFLFRLETAKPHVESARFAAVEELGLASRLSYLLWSTLPDEELVNLAAGSELRANLRDQVRRMLRDDRSDEFVSNFVGQWLRTRDVTQVSIDPIAVRGFREEFDELLSQFRARRSRMFSRDLSPEEQKVRDRFRELRAINEAFDGDLKRAMQRETEMCVEYIVRENLSLLDLIDCNYTFLNEDLAKHYGIPGVRGDEMRRVELPPDSPRGGLLGHGSMLVLTSNPTRTSPVKRGLFLLDNVLGTPAPPAPPNVPDLESSVDRFDGRKPSLRELLAVHREAALCSSCHSRMDPLGLALENFDALGTWRTEEVGAPIDAAGTLITGESFRDVRELRRILREHHARDFYRCVTEKLLTFAIGRGLDYTDEHTVDLIVTRLEKNGGRFEDLLMGVVESAPFQMIRVSQEP
jgi:hypothetical protein